MSRGKKLRVKRIELVSFKDGKMIKMTFRDGSVA